MNDIERKQFWDTLITLKGEAIEAERVELQKTIILPRFLYRYRAVNTKSLEALRTNHLYYSTANYYDDPFDTFVNIDFSGFLNMCKLLESVDNDGDAYEKCVEIVRQFFERIFPICITEEQIRFMIENVKNMLRDSAQKESLYSFIRESRNVIKKKVRSVCFSENGLNEVMWLKYADQYRGFALQFDLFDPSLLLCGKQEKCTNCGFRDGAVSLYPMYYSDVQYNGTRYAAFRMIADLLLAKIQEEDLVTRANVSSGLITLFGNMNWEIERISLIKKNCHKEDLEWRGIVNKPMKGKIMQEWIPSAVLLGLRMEETERDLVTALAKEAGVKTIFQTFINDRGMLDLIQVN